MLCRNPFVKAGAAFPCGNCEPCLFNRKRLWKHRIMLERMCHHYACFVTLTYNDDDLPKDEGIAVLRPKHMQDWLKRLRERVDFKFRFYGVGEYGSKSDRPHYHIMLFGYPSCVFNRTRGVGGVDRRLYPHVEPDALNCCDVCKLVQETWGMGNVDLGLVEPDSAAYVCDYTLKRMTKHDDVRLNGRTPEFCRMSLRPGIGAEAMWDVASDLMQNGLEDRIDVPTSLVHGKQNLPLGRYLRKRLRLYIGKDGDTPEEVIKAIAEEVRPVREAAFDASESLGKALSRLDDGRIRNINARKALYRKDKRL